jgi:hypothetical protein
VVRGLLSEATAQRIASGTATDEDRQALFQFLIANPEVTAQGERSVAVGGGLRGNVFTGDIRLGPDTPEIREAIRRELAAIDRVDRVDRHAPSDNPTPVRNGSRRRRQDDLLAARDPQRVVTARRRLGFVKRICQCCCSSNGWHAPMARR